MKQKILTLSFLFSFSFVVLAMHTPVVYAADTGAWAPTQCGKEPEQPVLDVASVERYNASTEKFAAYEKAARSYYACALKEAKKDYAPIMKGMTNIHSRMTENLNTLNAKLKAAHKKLGGKK